MKKKFLTFILIGICSLFTISDTWAQTAQVVNENGGTALNDGLKIQVNLNGNLAVYRQNRAQYYPGPAWSDTNGRLNGVRLTFRFSSGSTYNITTRSMTACSTTPVQQTGQKYTTSVTGYVQSSISNALFYVTLNLTYTHPNNYFVVDYHVRAPSGLVNPETVHLYLDHDAYILGHDGSRSYQVTNATGHFVGDYRTTADTGCGGGNSSPVFPSAHGFKVQGAFRSYYAGPYAARNNINNATLQLTNTIGTTCQDDGVAVEFTVGPLSAGQTGAKQVLHGYGNNMGEWDTTPVNDPVVPPGISSPVTVNFTSNAFSEQEGNAVHPANSIRISVSGGVLWQSQVCNFSLSGGSAVSGTDYTYVKGFIIPDGDYTTPQTLTLDNVTIIGNTICQNNRTFNISIDNPGNCNDLILRGTTINTATVTIVDDEPRPVITTSLPNLIYNHGQPVPGISFASDVAGATIAWTNSNTSIGLAANGTGNLPAFTATNTSTADIVATIRVTPTKDCTGTPAEFTITVKPKFTITYYYDGGVAPVTPNPVEYTFGPAVTISNEPTRLGYTFMGWTCAELSISVPTKPFVIPANTATNLNLYADWGSYPNIYDITYILNGGAIPLPNPNPSYYTVTTPNFTLKNPERPGYIFTGWTGTGIALSTNVTVSIGSVGNRTFTANWSAPIVYTISFNLDGGSPPSAPNKSTYDITEVPFTINTSNPANQPTKLGYIFLGWIGQRITSPSNIIEVTNNSFSTVGIPENLSYTALWATQMYTITYDLNYGTVSSPNPTSYTVTTPNFSLNNPTRDGYTFAGWTGTGLVGSSTAVTIPIGSTGARNYTATWTPINYPISYVDSNGSTPITAPGAPASYNDTQLPLTFTSVPVKPGFTFIDWDGLGASGSSITIPQGTRGNLTYQANWLTNDYTITFNANGGANPTIPAIWLGYDMTELPKSNINITPTRTGYSFLGWTGHGITNQTAPFTISSATTGVPGNLTYTAQWALNTYAIAYTLHGGTVSSSNPATYNVTQLPITLNNPTRGDGYQFAGWIGSNGTIPVITVSIPSGTTGNLNYEATWTLNSFIITYNLAGGTFSSATPEPSSYNTESPTITLVNPTRPGYDFVGWTGSNGMVRQMTVTIPTGSTGDRNYLANWEAIDYPIHYVDSDGSTPIPAPGAPTDYNDTQLPLSFANTPVKPGYTFIGWSGLGASGPDISIPAGTLGVLTYLAAWSTNDYAISFNLNGGTLSTPIPAGWHGYSMTDMPAQISLTPTLLGHTFLGWDGHGLIEEINPFDITASMPGVPGDLTFDAVWLLNNYNISYDANGGILVPGNPVSYNIIQTRSNLFISQDPTHLNPKNVFVGWTCRQLPQSPMQLSFLIPINATGDLDFTAHWSRSLTDLNPTNLNDTIIYCEGPKTIYGDPNGRSWNWIFPDGSEITTRNINTSMSGRYICRTDYGTVTVSDTLYAYFVTTPNTEIKYISTTGSKINRPQQFVIEIPDVLLPYTTTTWNVGKGTIMNNTADSLTVIWSSIDQYLVTARIEFNYGGVICSKNLHTLINITQSRLGFFVDQHVKGGNNNGTSWENAFRTIQQALSHATTGDYIWVAKGEYTPNTDQSFLFKHDSVEIYGGFAANENYLYERNASINPTIMKGNGNKPVIHIQGAEIRVDGFTIQDGRSVDGAGISFAGGGNGTIANCIIKNNEASGLGGGVYAVAQWYGYQSPRFINTEISGNKAFEGAGMFSAGSEFFMLNSTISGNKAETSGGIYIYGGNPEIQNSIIWGNISSKGVHALKNVLNDGGNPTYSYSIVGGSNGSGDTWEDAIGIDGSHNSDASPIFAKDGFESDEMTLREGNYRLASFYGPATNQGSNLFVLQTKTPWDIMLLYPRPSYVESLMMDLDFNERINQEIVDMGAYEYSSKTITAFYSREVILPDIGDAAIMNPGHGQHFVISMRDFVFTLTMTGARIGQKPVVTTTRTSIPDSEGVVIEKTGENTYTIRIRQVQENIYVSISFATGNADLSTGNIWAYQGNLHVKTNKASSMLTIYNFAGQLFKQQQLAEGETVIALPQGTYIVTLDEGEQQKIVIY